MFMPLVDLTRVLIFMEYYFGVVYVIYFCNLQANGLYKYLGAICYTHVNVI